MPKKIILSVFLPLFLAGSLATASEVTLKSTAPERYVVTKGDTLWGISSRYLDSPWQWPQLWRMNRDQIKNPHRIYPGDVVVLTKSGDTPVLRLEPNPVLETVKLSPRVRSQNTDTAIPSIPMSSIGPFLNESRILAEDELARSPQIIRQENGRVLLGVGNKAYVHGLPDSTDQWQVFRPGKTFTDPNTHEILGYEAVFLGDARTLAKGDPATIQITQSTEEIGVGDRLVRVTEPSYNNFVPHAPDGPIEAKIISGYGGISEFGQNSVAVLNRGRRDNIERGYVLALYRKGDIVSSGDSQLKFPDERYGLLMVFRVFDKVSYALIIQSHAPVHIGDLAKSPH
ncbi:MAG: LysM peptidoglycan-binding domain-containing protein [Burkholderiales bacterium]